MNQLERVLSLSHGLYEAVAREYTTSDLQKVVSMETFFRETLEFSFDAEGNIFRKPRSYNTATESPKIIHGLGRITSELLRGLPGIKFMHLGFHEIIHDTLYFHVYEAEWFDLNGAQVWQ